MYDLIIIGGGPAGLTAAVYAIRKRLKALLISEDLGGKTNFHLDLPDVAAHRLIRGAEIVNKFRNELEYLHYARHLERVTRIVRQKDRFVVHTHIGGELTAKAIIVATGAKQQLLNVPGEREFLSRGLCYSALSYAQLFIDKKAIVIGPDALALRAAAELAVVAKHVHLIGSTKEALLSPLGEKLTEAKNVEILEEYRVTSVFGKDFCDGVVAISPDGQEITVEADGTFVEMALSPNSSMVADLVELDENSAIKVDHDGKTNVPGIFAAGDVTDATEQVLVAVGDGAKAALSAYEYLLPSL